MDECNLNSLVSPTVVRSATSILTRDQISNIFGYQFDNEFIQSSSISATTTSPVVDQKLWLIGATIGPVVFVLVLIFIFCYLHYKCRPRPRQTLIPPGEKKVRHQTSTMIVSLIILILDRQSSYTNKISHQTNSITGRENRSGTGYSRFISTGSFGWS